MSVNGNQSNSNLWTVDGVNNMDVGSNRTLLVFPSVDSIQEFRVERNSFSAEFGQAQGAVVNLITKGGSNEFHGTCLSSSDNDSLNANNFFLNRAGQPKHSWSTTTSAATSVVQSSRTECSSSGRKSGAVRDAARCFRQTCQRLPRSTGDFSGHLPVLPRDPGTCRKYRTNFRVRDHQRVCDPFPGNRHS